MEPETAKVMERLAAIGTKMVFFKQNVMVRVTKRGIIFRSKNSGKHWKVLDTKWFETKRGFWGSIVDDFAKGTKLGHVEKAIIKASMAILPGKDATANRAANFRKKVYSIFRKQAGIRDSAPLPSKVVHAVKWIVPSAGATPSKNSGKHWKVLDTKWFETKRGFWGSIVDDFAKGTKLGHVEKAIIKASMAILPRKDATADRAANFRKKVYSIFRKQAGIRDLATLPSKVVHAVKWTVPSAGATPCLILSSTFDNED
ncbi:hypothetical protein KFL_003600130 [Klebsormidium nitens]|uniref:Uncharacterized protein n=1 Tax=Klebsormidium nitens TaxID=105231 RepID=A0A1Y1IAG4_KLENI|nr:hypothetical protein KFL_003600130 [Klebsormidium nitens]|eukprot:GAQ87553.1 hypothetical protein KFL_003600130 [Klebsormidium nitens]